MTRGRKVGWRTKDPLCSLLMIRMSRSTRAWLERESKRAGLTMSELVRQVLEDRIGGAK